MMSVISFIMVLLGRQPLIGPVRVDQSVKNCYQESASMTTTSSFGFDSVVFLETNNWPHKYLCKLWPLRMQIKLYTRVTERVSVYLMLSAAKN